jgi:hypothetical protein
MLPQSAALGSLVRTSGNGKAPHERDMCCFSTWSRGAPALCAGPSPAKRRDTPAEESGVARVFVLAKDGCP